MLVRRGGYTLVEVLVTLAVLVVISAILVPVMWSGGTSARIDAADTALQDVTDAIDGFRDDVGKWPPGLSQLVFPLTTGMTDLCGSGYTGGERNSWAGPYLIQTIPAGGLPVGIGTLQTGFTYQFISGRPYIALTVTGVEENDAVALDDQVDGDGSASAGTVRWSAPVNGVVTLTWMLPGTTC